jgi:hypothetical protein
MKKIWSCVVLVLLTTAAFSQMNFAYDKTGNRIKAQLIIEPETNPNTSAADALKQETLLAKEEINVYPNPASSAVQIDLKQDKGGKAVLYDLQGKTVRETTIIGRTGSIDISGLKNALYVLEVTSAGNVLKWKVLKQ